MKTVSEVGGHHLGNLGPGARHAKEGVDLSTRDDDGDSGGKARDHRSGDVGDQGPDAAGLTHES